MSEVIVMNAVSPYPSKTLQLFKAIKIECDRQKVGEDRQDYLYDAYFHVQNGRHMRKDSLDVGWLQYIAGLVEPDNGGKFRQIPVYFEGFGQAPPPDVVPRAMEAWVEWFNDTLPDGCHPDRISEADVIIKEFLDIHPFTDGNGRLAWLLRVWLLNQWDDPQPLPDYYGEN